MKQLLLFSYFYFIAVNVFANSIDPPKTSDEISDAILIQNDVVKTISIDSNVFKFEGSTLSEIQKFIGTGEITHSGDAGDSQYWLCYSFSTQTVWFISHGEMGGNEHAVTQVHAVAKNVGCPTPKNKILDIKTSFGWLGMNQKKLENIFGNTSTSQNGNLKFLYTGKETDVYNGKAIDLDVLAYVEAILEGGKVISIYASHVTSN